MSSNMQVSDQKRSQLLGRKKLLRNTLLKRKSVTNKEKGRQRKKLVVKKDISY